MNPREKAHQIWEAFWPSAAFVMAYAQVYAWFRDTSIQRLASRFAQSAVLTNTPTLDHLDKLGMTALIPVVVILTLAFVVYLFDRLLNATADVLPPHVGWRGGVLMMLGPDRLFSFWRRSSNRDLDKLSFEVDALVDEAYAERPRLVTTLDWRNKQFSDAGRLVLYFKGLMYWTLICAIFVSKLDRTSTLFRWAGLSALEVALYVGAVLLMTHRFIEVTDERLRIAEKMVGFDFTPDTAAFSEYQEAFSREDKRVRRPLIRFAWGSTYKLKRLARTVWRSA